MGRWADHLDGNNLDTGDVTRHCPDATRHGHPFIIRGQPGRQMQSRHPSDFEPRCASDKAILYLTSISARCPSRRFRDLAERQETIRLQLRIFVEESYHRFEAVVFPPRAHGSTTRRIENSNPRVGRWLWNLNCVLAHGTRPNCKQELDVNIQSSGRLSTLSGRLQPQINPVCEGGSAHGIRDGTIANNDRQAIPLLFHTHRACS